MENDAYFHWTKLFNDKVLHAYNNEKQELQNAAMLLTALKTEFQNVSEALDQQYNRLKRSLNRELKVQISSPTKSVSEKIQDISILEVVDSPDSKTDDRPKSTDLESPDIFNNYPLKNADEVSPVVDLSISDEDTWIEDSPTLVSKKKKDVTKFKKDKTDHAKKNILRGVDKENFFIDCTPEAMSPKRLVKKRGNANKKTQKSTLTQLFNEISTKGTTSNVPTPPIEESTDTNKTFQEWIKDDGSTEMGITKLLSFINKNDTPNSTKNLQDQIDDVMDSSNEVDEFSKAIVFDESTGMDSTPRKKPKVSPRAEPVVRGHARKLLNGFSCAQCREFYAGMNLSPTELQKRLDECSKHRYKYQPPEDTYPGIWDLTIPDENVNKT